jgi:hypothetical protein
VPKDGIDIGEILVARLFGDDVDRTAGGAASGEGRCRTAQDLDLFGEEVFTNADGRVADTIDEHVIAGIEAANEEAIAESVAALTGSKRHAGCRTDGIAQRRRVLVLENFPGEHRDGARRIQQLLGEFSARKPITFIGRGGISIRISG